MTMTREDRLRELELLPVWRLRNPVPIQTPISEAPETGTDAKLKAELQVEKQAKAEQPVPAPSKIDMPWVIVYAALVSQKEESLALVQNIVKAMRLMQGEYLVLDDVAALQQTMPGQLVVFGLNNLPDAMNSEGQSLATLRGIPLPYASTTVWVTHGIDDMLGNPSLKAEVWQDLRKALAHKVVAR